MPTDAGNFTLYSRRGRIPFSRGPSSPPTPMEQPPPWPHGLEYRGQGMGLSEPHTRHMVDPQYTARPAMKETSHTQPKHPKRSGTAASWRERRQRRTAGSPAQLPKAGTSHDRRVGLVPGGRGRTTSGAWRQQIFPLAEKARVGGSSILRLHKVPLLLDTCRPMQTG